MIRDKIGAKIFLTLITISIIPLLIISTTYFTVFSQMSTMTLNENENALLESSKVHLLELIEERANGYNEFFENIYNLSYSYVTFLQDIYENRSQFGDVPSYSDDLDIEALGIDPYSVSAYHVPINLSLNSDVNDTIYNTAPLDQIWRATASNNPYIAWTYFGSKFGVHRTFYWHHMSDSYDPRLRPWYQNAANLSLNPDQKTMVGTPYMDASGRGLMVTFSSPVYNESEFIGVIGIDVTIETIRQKIFKQMSYSSGYQFLIDTTGNIIARPNVSAEDDPRWDETFFYNNLMTTNNTKLNEIIIQNMTLGQKGLITVIFQDGKEKYFTYCPISSTSWSLGIFISVDEVIESVEDTGDRINSIFFQASLFSILFSVAIVVFVASAAYFLSKNISKPIVELTDAADNISLGHFDISIPIKSKDELSKLGFAFNRMIKSLRVIIDELEEL